MADSPKFNWAQGAFALLMFIMGGVMSATLFNHSEAIAQNERRTAVNRTQIAEVRKDVDHLEENSLSVTEQKDLCVTLAQLQDAVKQLRVEVTKLQEITQ